MVGRWGVPVSGYDDGDGDAAALWSGRLVENVRHEHQEFANLEKSFKLCFDSIFTSL